MITLFLLYRLRLFIKNYKKRRLAAAVATYPHPLKGS